MKNFVVIGVAGYIAPRHLQAIKETGHRLLAVTDPFDSVGILDRYFDNVPYFKEFERFDRHLEKLKGQKNPVKVDYVVICSPNYLHDAHIRFALRIGAIPICEKPLVLNPWNLQTLGNLEKQYRQKIFTLLQVRYHPTIVKLREKIRNQPDKIYDIDLTYVTSRGPWYDFSWKGDVKKSGGVEINIGIHFFDMLLWIFGDYQHTEVHIAEGRKKAGYIELQKARVRWFLSLNSDDLPEKCRQTNQRTYRSITIDGEELEFSDGFTDLHTTTYHNILKGEGFGVQDVIPVTNLLYQIRQAQPVNTKSDKVHPFLK